MGLATGLRDRWTRTIGQRHRCSPPRPQVPSSSSPSQYLTRPRDAPTPSRPNNAPKSEPNNVLGVFGLSIRTRERDLEDEFSRYGEVDKVTIVYDQRTDRSRGFGFITMRQVEDAGRCIEKLNGMVLHGRAIRVDYSATQKAHAPTPGEYRGEKRPFDDRFAADRRGGRGYDDRYRGGDRYGDRYDGGGRDDRRGGWDRPTWRDRDGPYGGAPRRDDDPYGGRARRDDDRERGGDRDAAPRGGNDREGGDRERRRSPSPARRRYSRSPERRPAAPTETREEPRPY